jgi:hypothetical protein
MDKRYFGPSCRRCPFQIKSRSLERNGKAPVQTGCVAQRIQAETIPFSFLLAQFRSANSSIRNFAKITASATAFLILGLGRTGPSEPLRAYRRRRHGGARLTLVYLPLRHRPPPRCCRHLTRRRFHLVLRRRDPVLLWERCVCTAAASTCSF